MVKRLFHSKIFVLFLSMLLLGFITGYMYSVLTSRVPKDNHVNTTENISTEVGNNQKEFSDF